MGLAHSRVTVFKLDDLTGALQDVSAYFRSASGLVGRTDRAETQQFGDAARRRGVKGLRDGGPIALGGLWKPATSAIHGRATKVLFDQYSLVGRTRTASVRRTIDLPETQQFGASWREREVVGLVSGGCSFAGLFNGSANELDAIFRAAHDQELPVVVSVGYGGFAIGSLVDVVKAAMTDHRVNSPQDGLVDASGEFESDDQVDLAVSLHDLVAEPSQTPPVNFTSVDETAASVGTVGGAVAHLHVTAFSGTSATIKVQHSVDNSVFTDLVTFAAVTGPTKERLEVSVGTPINRYVRAIISAGTWTSITFTVAFARRGFSYGTAGTFRHLAGLQGRAASSSFEYGPEGGVAAKPKLSGECRLSSLTVESSEEDVITFSAELAVSGAVAEGSF
jgi:hypothetical protein